MRRKVFFFDIENDQPNTNNYNFKSHRCPPQHQDLIAFENDLLELIQQITKPVRNNFQDKLRRDIDKIKSSTNAFIPADKSRNYYGMDEKAHDKLHTENITKILMYEECQHLLYF